MSIGMYSTFEVLKFQFQRLLVSHLDCVVVMASDEVKLRSGSKPYSLSITKWDNVMKVLGGHEPLVKLFINFSDRLFWEPYQALSLLEGYRRLTNVRNKGFYNDLLRC